MPLIVRGATLYDVKEVADMLNISQVQVSRLEKKILGQLKKNIVV